MGARFRSWWQQIKQHWVAIGVGAIVCLVVIVIIIVGYQFDWTGFNGNNKSGKTLWDWMQLLFIPVVLAVAGFWFNHRERKAAELRAENERKAAELHALAEREIEQQRAQTERDIAEDNQREASLQAYINEMSELLLHENLRDSEPEHEVRKLARIRTLTVLLRLDKERKWNVLRFLYEAELIFKRGLIYKSGILDEDQPVIDLSGADLSGISPTFAFLMGARLSGANLSHANLSRGDLGDTECISTNLSHAYLFGTNIDRADLGDCHLDGANLFGASMMGTQLHGTYLMYADLSQTDLRGADLNDADLSRANLTGATVSQDQLKKASSLKGATMPDGSKHP